MTNEQLRLVLRMHKSDITTLLQNICRRGWLYSFGYGRGTKYKLMTAPDANVDSLDANVDSLGNAKKAVNNEFLVSDKVSMLLMKKRLGYNEMKTILSEIAYEWRTIQELAEMLGRDKTYLRNHVLPNMVSNGVLEREFPEKISHHNQRYKYKCS